MGLPRNLLPPDAKGLLSPKIRGALNLSEERVTEILRLIGATFQQVYIVIDGLEKSLGLDPNDPVVPFVLFLGTSATLWGFYRVWLYGGYSGDLSPQLTLKLLPGKEDAILIDVRPEAREFSEKEMAFHILGELLGFAMQL
uniref:Uncharacterized protein n=1 Tax=Populus davidiana TaxID=266767 RepID=A0A6M2F763_9ROSI